MINVNKFPKEESINLEANEDEYLNDLDNNDNNDNNNNNNQYEILNQGVVTPPISRKVLMPKTPRKKLQYITRVNGDGSMTLHRKRVRRVLAFESPKREYKISKNKDNYYPSLKNFHESMENMKNNNRYEMTNEERSNHFSMEPQPIGRSTRWAPHKFC